MVNDNLKVTGQVSCFMNGVLKGTHNLVVDGGKAWIAGRMVGGENIASHIAVGSNNTPSAGGQTALLGEIFRKIMEVAGGESAGAVATFKVTLGAGEATGTINEAGIFDASSSGTMVARSVVGPYVKGANDVLSIVWTITVS